MPLMSNINGKLYILKQLVRKNTCLIKERAVLQMKFLNVPSWSVFVLLEFVVGLFLVLYFMAFFLPCLCCH